MCHPRAYLQHVTSECDNFVVQLTLIAVLHRAAVHGSNTNDNRLIPSAQSRFHLDTTNATNVTEVRSASARLFADTWRPLACVITALYYVAIIFPRRVWYRALSLRYECIRSLGIVLIP